MPGKSRAQLNAEARGVATETAFPRGLSNHVTNLCLLGATNADLAKALEVEDTTIERWLRDNPSFRRCVRAGREVADGEVARSLYRRAVGYEHKASKIFNNNGKALVVDYIERYPPDTNAASLWLSNRQRGKWRAANAGADVAPSFDLGAFVQAITGAIQAGQRRPGDDAKPVTPLDVDQSSPKSDSGEGSE